MVGPDRFNDKVVFIADAVREMSRTAEIVFAAEIAEAVPWMSSDLVAS